MTKTNGIGESIGEVFYWGWLLICLAGGLYGAWWIWPSGITQTPLGTLTLGMIGKAIAAFFVPFIAVGFGIKVLGDD